ncbi:response regulator [Hymenobacter arcticus]
MKTYLIDDDELALFLARYLIQTEGFAEVIHSFTAAEEALASLATLPQEELPQVIFLDLNMPVMNGWQFLDALAPYEADLLGRCRIYILTSSLALADLEKSRRYRLVESLIHKPLDRGELQAILGQLNTSVAGWS